MGGAFADKRKKAFVDGGVRAEFGMERGSEEMLFLDEGGFARVFGENVDTGANAFDDGSADENHFHRLVLELGGAKENVAGELAAVGVAEDGHLKKTERSLRGIFDVGGEQDRAGARAEDGTAFAGEPLDGVEEAFFLKELELGGAFAAGENEAIAASELRRRANLEGFGAKLAEHGSMSGEVALDGEDADFGVRMHQLF